MALRILTYFWLALTLTLLLKPEIGFEQAVFFIGEDKVVHFGLFVTLTLLWCRYMVEELMIHRSAALIMVLTVGLFLSGVTELMQHYIPGRGTDWADFFFNVIGVTSGMIFYVLFEKRGRLLAD